MLHVSNPPESKVIHDPAAVIVRVDRSGHTELGVTGVIDLENSAALRRALDGHSPVVQIDLSGVRFVDAAAIRVMVETADAARREGGRCSLLGLDRFHRRLIESLGLTERLGVPAAA